MMRLPSVGVVVFTAFMVVAVVALLKLIGTLVPALRNNAYIGALF